MERAAAAEALAGAKTREAAEYLEMVATLRQQLRTHNRLVRRPAAAPAPPALLRRFARWPPRDAVLQPQSPPSCLPAVCSTTRYVHGLRGEAWRSTVGWQICVTTCALRLRARVVDWARARLPAAQPHVSLLLGLPMRLAHASTDCCLDSAPPHCRACMRQGAERAARSAAAASICLTLLLGAPKAELASPMSVLPMQLSSQPLYSAMPSSHRWRWRSACTDLALQPVCSLSICL